MTVDNTHNIALRLFNRDASSPIPCIVFGAIHCDLDILSARTHPNGRFYMGGHTTINPDLYSPDGALLEEHLIGVSSFSLLDLYSRPEALLPKHFQAAPRDQWAASFVVVEPARRHNALTLRVRFASPFAISQGHYFEADYTFHLLSYCFGSGEDVPVFSQKRARKEEDNNVQPTPFVLCKDLRTDERTTVKIEQPSETTLRCEGILYQIDPVSMKDFKLHNCHTANPKKDGLYTMYFLSASERGHAPDAEVNETWHNVAVSSAKK